MRLLQLWRQKEINLNRRQLNALVCTSVRYSRCVNAALASCHVSSPPFCHIATADFFFFFFFLLCGFWTRPIFHPSPCWKRNNAAFVVELHQLNVTLRLSDDQK